jgi:uncharacterized protein DUF4197
MQGITKLTVGLAVLALASGTARAGLDVGEVAKGLIEALKVGIENTVKQTGAPDGFLKNEAIKILLPEKLQPAAKLLDKIGGAELTDTLVEKMNRAAEAAAPAAKDIFLAAIQKLTFQDAMAILKGKDDEATQFLQANAGEQLKAAFLPIVTQSIESVGALKAYQDLLHKVKGLPLLSGGGMNLAEFDLNQYVTEKAVDGIFHVLGQEEQKIRHDPKARVTDLLGKVFGSIGG